MISRICDLKCPLKSNVAKWLYGTGITVLIGIFAWGGNKFEKFIEFKSVSENDIAELKAVVKETKLAVEKGNKENLERDHRLEKWMVRLDERLNDRNEKLVSIFKDNNERASR